MRMKSSTWFSMAWTSMELVPVSVLEVVLNCGWLKRTTREQHGNHAWKPAKITKIVPVSLTKDPEHSLFVLIVLTIKVLTLSMKMNSMDTIEKVKKLPTTQNAYSILELECEQPLRAKDIRLNITGHAMSKEK